MTAARGGQGIAKGRILVERLLDGSFPKNHYKYYAEDFSRELEDMARYQFDSYLGSCGRFLQDSRIKERGHDYIG